MFGLCEAKIGTEVNEASQAGASRHKRSRHDVETDSGPGGLQGSGKGGEKLED